jgi:hypothetical protein
MKTRAAVLVGMILLVALARLVPHPPNFAPVGAIALFGAAHFRKTWAAFLVPLAAMLVSDAALQVTTGLGLYSGWLAHSTGFHRGMWVVYGTIALVTAVGLLLRKRKPFWAVAGCVLASSALFFVITNFAVWADGTLYPKTPDGLLLCYTAAIPFFHWTLLGDAFFAAILFGGFALAERRYPMLRLAAGVAGDLSGGERQRAFLARSRTRGVISARSAGSGA